MTNLVTRLRAEYQRTGAYAPSATCKHGVHPYDCREGCAPPTFEAADEIEHLRTALKVAQQAILEFSHAQESGPSWYTGGKDGMYQQVRMWLRRGLESVQGALGPYDENGVFLKEKSVGEQAAAQFPINRAMVHPYGYGVIPLLRGSVSVTNDGPDFVVVTVDRATVVTES